MFLNYKNPSKFMNPFLYNAFKCADRVIALCKLIKKGQLGN